MEICGFLHKRGDKTMKQKRRNKIIQILMDRDGMTEKEAKEILLDCREMIADGASIEEVLSELKLDYDDAVYLLLSI